jgi:nitrogen fixation/metabolism regulation signal transduction histidine kinase
MPRWPKESHLLYGLVGAFAAVALAFVLSSIVTYYASREIDDASQDLLRNALPSVIFEPYRRGPGPTQPGLGLGLATVKRLVLAHGGRLGVRNAPSGGAVFWFDLPRAPETQPEESHEPSPVHARAGASHPLH